MRKETEEEQANLKPGTRTTPGFKDRYKKRLEQKRNWEHHRRKTDPQYRKEELGTIGSISQHKHPNPEMEATIVRKALLQIRRQRLNTYTYREEMETVKQSV